MAAVRATTNNARAGKNGVFLAKHLDGPDGKAAKMGGLVYTWHRDWKKDKGKSFEQVEADFYEAHFSAGLDAQNERHRKGGHKNRMKTMDEYRAAQNTCPECTLSYLGNKEAYNALSEQAKAEYRKRLWAVGVEFWNWRQKAYPQVVGLDMALHVEDGAPHIHERHVWIGHDKDGNEIVNQEAALREMGVLPPEPGEKVSRYNNAKMTYTERCREKMIEIAKAHGVEIIEEPREAGEKGLSQAKYKTRDEQRKQREAEQARKEAEEAARKAAEDAQEAAQEAQAAREWVGQVKAALDEYSEAVKLETETAKKEAEAAKEAKAAALKFAKETRQQARMEAQTLKQAGYEEGYDEGEKAAQEAARGQIEAAKEQAKEQGYIEGYEIGASEGGSTARGRLAEMNAQRKAQEQAEQRKENAQRDGVGLIR